MEAPDICHFPPRAGAKPKTTTTCARIQVEALGDENGPDDVCWCWCTALLFVMQCPDGSSFTSGSCSALEGMGRLASPIPNNGTGAVTGFACGTSSNVGNGQDNTTVIWAHICCCKPSGW